jgi:farnesyl diphosphate synthase
VAIADFEVYLKENLPKAESFHPHYEAALAQMLLAGGKRFRPALVLAVVQGLNPLMRVNAMPVALAIEMLHTYSLIHDDLPAMDDAPLRRGHETLHITYDETTAILAGDALNTHAFWLLSRAPLDPATRVELIETLSFDGGTAGMVLGQALDCHYENQRLAQEQVAFIHRHKTGRLIAASLKMGALVAGADERLKGRLYDLGMVLGLFFQVRDDIIDATQDAAQAGKTTQNDGDKNSYVTLLGLPEAQAEADRLACEAKALIAALPAALERELLALLAGYFN